MIIRSTLAFVTMTVLLFTDCALPLEGAPCPCVASMTCCAAAQTCTADPDACLAAALTDLPDLQTNDAAATTILLPIMDINCNGIDRQLETDPLKPGSRCIDYIANGNSCVPQ